MDDGQWIAGSDPEPQGWFSKDCYRIGFSGVYVSLYSWQALRPDLVKIHDGECHCEGRSILDCQEPGDPDAQASG